MYNRLHGDDTQVEMRALHMMCEAITGCEEVEKEYSRSEKCSCIIGL